jgi:hypothetical protein
VLTSPLERRYVAKVGFWTVVQLVGDTVLIIGLTVFGTIAVFSPKRLQEYYRSLHQRSAVYRVWPATLVLKPWYVYWLRFGGILILGFAGLGAYAVLVQITNH